MKINLKLNIAFALTCVAVLLGVGWVFNAPLEENIVPAIVFGVLAFVLSCIDDQWTPKILAEELDEAEDVQES